MKETSYRTDDYDNTTLDLTGKTPEEYKIINDLVTNALKVIGKEITDGKYYLCTDE